MKESLKLIPEIFFDFFAYFLPGCIFILLFSLLDRSFSIFFHLKSNFTEFEKIVFIIFVGYILGHIFTTFSEYIIVKPINVLFGNPTLTLIGVDDGIFKFAQPKLNQILINDLLSIYKKKFKNSFDLHTFFICENDIRINYPDIGFLIRKRHAFEHLCRNLVVTFLLLILLVKTDICIFFIFTLLICFIRYLDYRKSWPKVVYENFYILNSKKLANHSKK